MEEYRCVVERFVLTLINLKIISEKDFETQVSDVVWVNESGRKRILTKWQEKRDRLCSSTSKTKNPFWFNSLCTK